MQDIVGRASLNLLEIFGCCDPLMATSYLALYQVNTHFNIKDAVYFYYCYIIVVIIIVVVIVVVVIVVIVVIIRVVLLQDIVVTCCVQYSKILIVADCLHC